MSAYRPQNTWNRLVGIVAAILFFVACPISQGVAMSNGCPKSGAKIFLSADGIVTLNGRKVDAAQLKNALLSLSPKPTMVCYSREAPQGEPPPAMPAVLDAIMAMRLPIGLFTDGTFTVPVKP
jgi:hypothetical protein